MRFRRLVTKLVVVLCLSATVCFAQSQAVVKRNVNLRPDPSTDQAVIQKLAPQTTVTLVEPDPTNGFYHVRTADGSDGWVWGKSIQIQTTASGNSGGTVPPLTPTSGAAADLIATDWDKPDPQDSVFRGDEGDCAETGDGGDSDTNARKNRVDLPASYHLVTWDAINSQSYPQGAPRSRISWSQSQLNAIKPFEGAAITVEGYLYKVKVESSSPSGKKGGETTNCHAHLANDVDWHMPLTAHAKDGENVAIIVETTPRLRQQHPNWTVDRLKPWTFMMGSHANAAYNGQPVRISGWLMLDPEHHDMINSGLRSTLWEIHPITRIEVFQNGQWVDLDQ